MRDETNKPLICITRGTTGPRRPDLYAHSIEEAGGRPCFLSSDEGEGVVLSRFDGFLIPGGRDIHPRYYGEETLFEISLEDAARIDFEISFLREIIRLWKPLLGICYGMQLINIFFKGDLYQDIGRQIRGSLDHREGAHSVRIADNPFIEKGETTVNSAHHQAVRDLGPGLWPLALAPDGVIEAFYGKDHPFLLGLQWHPERMDTSLSRQIFRHFVEACRAVG